jgi:putative membrane protein
MLEATIQKNDKKAYWFIITFSIIIFVVITFLGRIELDVDPGFDIHLFAKINAITNTLVSICLLWALIAVKNGKYKLHRNVMYTAMVLSVFFLLSYVAHHLLAGEARFGDVDGNGVVSEDEKLQVGSLRYIYLLLLATHILLAAVIMPFVLFTAYRALTGEWEKHKKLARYTWPIWFYVAVTGPVIYLMISPYYQ